MTDVPAIGEIVLSPYLASERGTPWRPSCTGLRRRPCGACRDAGHLAMLEPPQASSWRTQFTV